MTDAEQGEELLRRYAVDWDKYTAQAGRIEALERERDALRAALNEVAKILRQSRGQNAMRLFTSLGEAVDSALTVLARTQEPQA